MGQEEKTNRTPDWREEARNAAKQRPFLGIRVTEKGDSSSEKADLSEIDASLLLFPPETTITDKIIIREYGNRLSYLCEVFEVKHKTLAKKVNCSSQTITNIIKGVPDSVNIDFCNQFAEFFQCSAYYLVGYADTFHGIRFEGKMAKLPFIISDKQTHMNIVQTGHWAILDPELFQLLDETFYLDTSKREAVKVILRALNSESKHKK